MALNALLVSRHDMHQQYRVLREMPENSTRSGRRSALTALPTVSQEQVDTFRLRRHRLLDRSRVTSPTEVVSGLCGVQAQVMSAAALQVWVRSDCPPAGIDAALWADRTLIKTWCMRGTLHLVAAGDIAVVAGALRSDYWKTNLAIARGVVTAEELQAVIDAVADALDERCLTREEIEQEVTRRLGSRLGELIGGGWGFLLKQVARWGLLCFGPSRGRNVTFVRLDQWASATPALPESEALVELLRRYLSAYGPTRAADFGSWTGLGGRTVARAWTALGPELTDVDVQGRAMSLLAADLDELCASEATARVRLLPAFDVYLLGHSGRSHLADRAFHRRISRTAGWISPVVLVGGRVIGTWSHELRGRRLAVEVELFQPANRRVTRDVEREAARYAQPLAAAECEVVVRAP